jgi:hypothetical protein
MQWLLQIMSRSRIELLVNASGPRADFATLLDEKDPCLSLHLLLSFAVHSAGLRTGLDALKLVSLAHDYFGF